MKWSLKQYIKAKNIRYRAISRKTNVKLDIFVKSI